MKAVVCERYGGPDQLKLKGLPVPEPSADQLLIKVQTTTVNRTDLGLLRGYPYIARLALGLFRPKHQVLGLDFSGEVVATGPAVQRFKVGDPVFGMSPSSYGAHAEYICLSEKSPIALIPDNLSYLDCVVTEGAWYADVALRSLAVQAGQHILIYGASGAIGIAAVQLAKLQGARVTAVVASAQVELARQLGADVVIDYTAQDFTATPERFNSILDAVGKTSYGRCRHLLLKDGRFAATDVGRFWQNPLLALFCTLTGSKKVRFAIPDIRENLLTDLSGYLKDVRYRAVIDRVYPLEQISAAYQYVETGQKVGIVAIAVAKEQA
ncbi:NAD(P)-dependent alcohol dehydrogenase [Alkalimonas amylolytica]|uniref:NADPH:quinone reductase n=1 Tax=Alkalimonas amylolytica TaxID=152573 RepID=A0A1H3XSW1_ALKAM|nr:NAD(P)-dependent alcohol dehydrogenase [Alkalimonas amylolytica]SEA02466.1 NADPH:quinone reductase [Alkalimonas amylolytica]